jgi:hypothetical protein
MQYFLPSVHAILKALTTRWSVRHDTNGRSSRLTQEWGAVRVFGSDHLLLNVIRPRCGNRT